MDNPNIADELEAAYRKGEIAAFEAVCSKIEIWRNSALNNKPDVLLELLLCIQHDLLLPKKNQLRNHNFWRLP